MTTRSYMFGYIFTWNHGCSESWIYEAIDKNDANILMIQARKQIISLYPSLIDIENHKT